jgi:hypothetical protein
MRRIYEIFNYLFRDVRKEPQKMTSGREWWHSEDHVTVREHRVSSPADTYCEICSAELDHTKLDMSAVTVSKS